MKTGSERFHEILSELGDLHDQKQVDYGTDVDPFANVRSTESWGVPAWVGAGIRLGDKVQRLKSMYRNGYLNNESLEDSLRDIAVYAIIGLVLYEELLTENSTEAIKKVENGNIGKRSQEDIDVDLNAVAERLRKMVAAEVYEFDNPKFFTYFEQ